MDIKFVPTPKNLELLSKSLALMTSYIALDDMVTAAAADYEDSETLVDAFTDPIYDSVEHFCDLVEQLQSKEKPTDKDLKEIDDAYESASLIVMTYMARMKEGTGFAHLESQLVRKRAKVKLTLVE